jgi:hypothetical protein
MSTLVCPHCTKSCRSKGGLTKHLQACITSHNSVKADQSKFISPVNRYLKVSKTVNTSNNTVDESHQARQLVKQDQPIKQDRRQDQPIKQDRRQDQQTEYIQVLKQSINLANKQCEIVIANHIYANEYANGHTGNKTYRPDCSVMKIADLFTPCRSDELANAYTSGLTITENDIDLFHVDLFHVDLFHAESTHTCDDKSMTIVPKSMIIVPKTNEISVKFVYYLLTYMKEDVIALSDDITRSNTIKSSQDKFMSDQDKSMSSQDKFMNISIVVPAREIQNKIVEELTLIQQNIKSNLEMIEQMGISIRDSLFSSSNTVSAAKEQESVKGQKASRLEDEREASRLEDEREASRLEDEQESINVIEEQYLESLFESSVYPSLIGSKTIVSGSELDSFLSEIGTMLSVKD